MINIIGMLTLFSTMALGNELTPDVLNYLLGDLMNTLQAQINDLQAQIDDQQASRDVLESKQVTGDYYIVNDEDITIPIGGDYIPLYKIEMREGETLDLTATLTAPETIDFRLLVVSRWWISY